MITGCVTLIVIKDTGVTDLQNRSALVFLFNLMTPYLIIYLKYELSKGTLLKVKTVRFKKNSKELFIQYMTILRKMNINKNEATYKMQY